MVYSKEWYEKYGHSVRAANKRYYQKNKKVINKTQVERCKKYDKRQRILWSLKSRATKRGFNFNLELEDIVIPEVCPVLGIPLVVDGTPNSPNLASVDRIDNKLGYVKGNIRVISLRANSLKSDGELWELQAIVKYMEQK